MKCANCRQEESPAYTLWAHVDGDQRHERDDGARSDGGEATVKLQFCSIECLNTWT
jgi:hypothetical protein